MESAQKTGHAEPVTIGLSIGREFYRGKKIPAGVLDGRAIERWESALRNPARSKLVLLHSGNAVLSVCGRETTIIAPAAVFVPHEADVALKLTAGDRNDKLILFHPQFVFETLTLDFDFSDDRDPGACNDGFMLYRFSPERDPAERSLFLEPGVYRFLSESAERMGDELESQSDWSWPCRARSYLLEILIACTKLKESPTGLFAAENAPTVEPGIEGLYGYLIARLGERLSVDEIAHAFGTNRTSLQVRVRRATGLSVTQYVISLRVQTASVLLRNTSLPIAEIMDRTGFADESHFSRSFKRFTGQTPSDFRKAFIVPSYVR